MTDFDAKLKRFLGLQRDLPVRLREAIEYSALAPGKRIRPAIAIASSSMHGLSERSAISLGIALELFHCFTLVHDDLPCIDNDDLRRGQPSSHVKYGEALAVLVGDSLMALANQSFFEAIREAPAEKQKAAADRWFSSTGPQGVIGGQALEMCSNEFNLSKIKEIHQLKTAALFLASFLIPSDLGKSTAEQSLALHEFADVFGTSFQLLDDWNDLENDPNPALNVFHHESSSTLISETHGRLESAIDRMHTLWGERFKPLVEATDEVLQMLRQLSIC